MKYAKPGYNSRSAAIRDWVGPPVRPPGELLAQLAVSSAVPERGEARSLKEVAGEYAVDFDDA